MQRPDRNRRGPQSAKLENSKGNGGYVWATQIRREGFYVDFDLNIYLKVPLIGAIYLYVYLGRNDE